MTDWKELKAGNCYLIGCLTRHTKTIVKIKKPAGKCYTYHVFCSGDLRDPGCRGQCVINIKYDILFRKLSDEESIIFKLEYGL